MALLPFMPQAAYGQMGTTSAPLTAPVQDVTEPFVWGAAGRRMTPEQMDAERAIAQSLMQSNYSPVGSVWEGLGRVADNVTGALQARKLDKTDQANTARSDAVLQALMGGNGGDVAAQAMTDPYLSPQVQGLAKMMWDRANPKPQAPSEFDRSLKGAGIDPASPEGVALYRQRANTMATPTPQFVPDGVGGGQWVVPPTGGPAAPALPAAPVGKLTPITGGTGSNAGGGF